MTLNMLIKDMEINDMHGNPDIEIAGIAYDSRKVKQGDIFVAVRGGKVDGHIFIKDAVKRGAVALVHEGAADIRNMPENAAFIFVEDSRKALAYLSNNFYGRPSENLTVIGVTGTNGKTTTTYLLKEILETWGKGVGLIGTIDYIVKDKYYSAPHTTPEALEFQSILREMVSSGCSHAVTEVSSHALVQKRVDYTKFQTAVFTNLTRDHLDFHLTMEGYFSAKERLFKEFLSGDGAAVINFDDIYGRRLISKLQTPNYGLKKVLTYGIETGADMTAVNIKSSFKGLELDIRFGGGAYSIKSQLIGIHNVYNILSAAGAAAALDIPWGAIINGIGKMTSVKGRFERVDAGQDFLCIVDYAHTEDAIERLICTAIELLKEGHGIGSKIITVFGCGGNRDRGKRPRMGAVVTKLSDYAVITSDNPRDEDPDEIIKEIEAGVLLRNYVVEPDREKAIRKAVEAAGKGDILLVAGKGHEDYQEIKGVRHRFKDQEIIRDAIRVKLGNV